MFCSRSRVSLHAVDMEVECEDVYSVSQRQSLYIDIIDAVPSVFNFDIDVKQYGTLFKTKDFCRQRVPILAFNV